MMLLDHNANPQPSRVPGHFDKALSKAYKCHPWRHLHPYKRTFQLKVLCPLGPQDKESKYVLGKLWVLYNWSLNFFFFHPGKCKLSLSASRTKGNWSLEEERLTFSSISKCLLILRSYLGQPIFSSFSSSSCPLVAFNSVFPPLLTQGETCALLSKIKKKKRRKRKFTSQGLGFVLD